jgi:benzylsuccinate CoA-transferase BbsF subunit
LKPNRSILQGIRVLDCSWVLAGPYATRLLADFGAEVIKVHPLAEEADDKFSRDYYKTWNRNKRSITLDVNKPAGLEIARKLVTMCDIVVENFNPRVMINWGLDYPELKKVKPDIILLSMSVAGQTGPSSHYSGFGPTVQALSGLSYLTGYPGQPPSGIGYSYSDHAAALYGSLAVLAALEYRRQTGAGQHIDLSQMETATSLLADSILDYTQNSIEPRPLGNRSPQAAPHGIYPCLGRDRWCAIAVTSEVEWSGFKKALGLLAWTSEARFATASDRLTNADALEELVSQWTRELPAEKVMERLQKEGVPAGVVQNAADLACDPQLLAGGFFAALENPAPDNKLVDASPIKLSDSPARYRQGAPAPDQDNAYVYGQLLGMTKDQIESLKQEKVI